MDKLLNIAKVAMLIQAYIGTYAIIKWGRDGSPTSPLWFEFIVGAIMVAACVMPVVWMITDNEMDKRGGKS